MSKYKWDKQMSSFYNGLFKSSSKFSNLSYKEKVITIISLIFLLSSPLIASFKFSPCKEFDQYISLTALITTIIISLIKIFGIPERFYDKVDKIEFEKTIQKLPDEVCQGLIKEIELVESSSSSLKPIVETILNLTIFSMLSSKLIADIQEQIGKDRFIQQFISVSILIPPIILLIFIVIKLFKHFRGLDVDKRTRKQVYYLLITRHYNQYDIDTQKEKNHDQTT
ncbi:hypothetical protein [Streptococcus sp. sy004]|uniref:hypothetical protein n=1 Tax=Streptococcus sp. sy004 TaxID=2600149 RepID=UPI0011B505AE|nr:hypothetical protein [Streptococcus sp. sy004]TWT11298.1 hypothetical protein FRX54_03365 [Streptococcus sp. sy004]